MSTERITAADPDLGRAIEELSGMIRQRHPEATFRVAGAEDDPAIIHLLATVDVDDTEGVVDLVIDRMLQLQLEDGLPIYVIPVRTPERVAALRRAAMSKRLTSADGGVAVVTPSPS